MESFKKNNGYFEWTRKDILPLLPEKIDRILEIGCGEGNTLTWIKSIKSCKWIAGVELSHNAALKAKKNKITCYEGNIEVMELKIEEQTLDVILCLDVLEHLSDPWTTIKKLHKLLTPGGVIISSIPNIQHYSVTVPFIFKGNWNYSHAGILDKTHLRFFVKKTAVELMEISGLKTDKIIWTVLRKKVDPIIIKIIPDYFKRFFEYQYLIRVKKIR